MQFDTTAINILHDDVQGISRKKFNRQGPKVYNVYILSLAKNGDKFYLVPVG